MSGLFPSFARKREVELYAPYTKAAAAVRDFAAGLSPELRERFCCLVADAAQISAWIAGRRTWTALQRELNREGDDTHGAIVTKMVLAEALETALWGAMRAHDGGLYRMALGLVMLRLRLATAWVEPKVVAVRNRVGAMIFDAFDAAEMDPGRPADLDPADFAVAGAEGLDKLVVFLRDRALVPLDRADPVFAEDWAGNEVVRAAYGENIYPGEKSPWSACHNPMLRSVNEIGIHGAEVEVGHLFGTGIVQAVLADLHLAGKTKEHVDMAAVLRLAAEARGLRLAADLEPLAGAAAAGELRNRFHAALAYGRAAAPAFILAAMAAEPRWRTLAGDCPVLPSAPAATISAMLEASGSWPAIVPPEGVTVRAVDQTAEPSAASIRKRNQWTGREFPWYWIVLFLGVMLYGLAVQMGLV